MTKEIVIHEAAAVARIAEGLIAEHHPHLADANIRYLFTNQKRRKCDRVRLGSAQRLSGLTRYLASGEARSVADGADFVILIDGEEWGLLDPDQRVALVDHELCHCGIRVDKDGEVRFALRGHDVEEFTEVIKRHGLWRHDLMRMGDAVEQLRLPLGG